MTDFVVRAYCNAVNNTDECSFPACNCVQAPRVSGRLFVNLSAAGLQIVRAPLQRAEVGQVWRPAKGRARPRTIVSLTDRPYSVTFEVIVAGRTVQRTLRGEIWNRWVRHKTAKPDV